MNADSLSRFILNIKIVQKKLRTCMSASSQVGTYRLLYQVYYDVGTQLNILGKVVLSERLEFKIKACPYSRRETRETINSFSFNFQTLVSCKTRHKFIVNIFKRNDQFYLLRTHVSLFACNSKLKEVREGPVVILFPS